MAKLDLNTAIKAGKTAIELGASAQKLAEATKDLRSTPKGDLGRSAGRFAFNEGADVGKAAGKSWLKTFEVIPRLVCRGLQFVLALVVCGFYGNRVDADRKADDGFSAEWIFAILVAGVSAATSLVFMLAAPLSAIPIVGGMMKMFKTYRAFAWDGVLFVLWIVVFGIFAGIFLHRDSDEEYKGSSTRAMKMAVWFDLINAILWLASTVYGGIKTYLGDKADHLTDKAGQKIFAKRNKGEGKWTEMDNYPETV
ncbi:uncharacterized protein DNG_10065 [Cephalotrichum gorgonifer]|uniref:MARVEL domain-containing protein n=1 Tax=Cephalotrichum gorgonifer TaxID=2041049 RepID=A0AAE8N6X3_9PEZI|nr:uncharacterized protein DNG_10065 [Cephalotrichum gorgonifer]